MIYRKMYTMPMPASAEIIERDGKRVARWRLRSGKLRSANVVECKDGKTRVRGQSCNYMVVPEKLFEHLFPQAETCGTDGILCQVFTDESPEPCNFGRGMEAL